MTTPKNPNNRNSSPVKDNPWHHRLALIIILLSFTLILAVIAGIFFKGDSTNGNFQTVLTAILPLVGAWIGTVIAFYFSSKNLEAATNSVQKLYGQVSSQDKLQSILVKDKMISKSSMYFQPWTDDKSLNLKEILANLKSANKGKRIPILDKDSHPKYMIHDSEINEYLTEKSTDTTVTVATLTLENLLSEKPELRNSYEIVNDKATLADAKKAMENNKYCQDVFVTLNGTKNEEVLGLITNIIIEENSKV
jgi:hypothetical protein